MVESAALPRWRTWMGMQRGRLTVAPADGGASDRAALRTVPRGWCAVRWSGPGAGGGIALAEFTAGRRSPRWALPAPAPANEWHLRPFPTEPWRASFRPASAAPAPAYPPLDYVVLGRTTLAVFVAWRWAAKALAEPRAAASIARTAAIRLLRHGWRALLGDARRALVTDCEYAWWVEAYDAAAGANERPTVPSGQGPVISVIVPVHDPDEADLRACLSSVVAQTYPNWELCVADDASTRPYVRRILEAAAASDARVRLRFREANGHISEATNSALALATGEFVAFLDHDDVLAPDALATFAAVLARGDVDLAYSDEDKLDPYGQRFEPHFKPDWNPALFLANNYVCHLCVMRRARVEAVGGLRRGYEGAQDYDLLLRVVRTLDPARIRHVPRVLYHWRAAAGSTATGVDAKPYAHAAGRRALQEHLALSCPQAKVSDGPLPTTYRVQWPIPSPAPLASILIAAVAPGEALARTLQRVAHRTTWPDVELLVATPAGAAAAVDALLGSSAARGAHAAIAVADERRVPALLNAAAGRARGKVLAFLDPSAEPCDERWLGELVSHVLCEGVAVAGGRILEADGTVASAGLVVGVEGIAGHAFAGLGVDRIGINARAVLAQDVSALSCAFAVLRRDAFVGVGGFDAAIPARMACDVDLCLRLGAAGWRLVFTPYASVRRYGAKAASTDEDAEARATARRMLAERWSLDSRADPSYNVNLTISDGSFGLAWPPRQPAS